MSHWLIAAAAAPGVIGTFFFFFEIAFLFIVQAELELKLNR